MLALATTQDVVDRWRPLSDAETSLANTLLDDASDMIRVRWPDVDDRIESGALSSSTTVRVVAGMVRRAMMNRGSEGITQQSEATGPFNQSNTYANPNNNLYLSADDIRTLDGGWSGQTQMGWLI